MAGRLAQQDIEGQRLWWSHRKKAIESIRGNGWKLGPRGWLLEGNWDIRPTDPVWIVRRDPADGRLHIEACPWTAALPFSDKLITPPNATSEKYLTSRWSLWARGYPQTPDKNGQRDRWQRAVMLVSGDYVWPKKAGPLKGRRLLIRPRRAEQFCLAGLHLPANPDHQDPHRRQGMFAVLTTQPGPLWRTLHHREPVVLSDEAVERWLDPDLDEGELAALCQCAPDDSWEAVAVPSDTSQARPSMEFVELLPSS